MKRILLIIFFLSPLIFCQTGEYKIEYYKNGKIKSEGFIINGKKDGIYKEYYPNGQLYKE